ncbi:hypothetical protein [Aggregatilinea lenta]|uniref:hypothetical protein n=1 Tax=Aggregatilinea lenta TaxID=913108 RepID=UPI0013C3633C|nr:hypothetical protein [Aggregatilinea lenta]
MFARRFFTRSIVVSVFALVVVACGLRLWVVTKSVSDLGELSEACEPTNPREIEDIAWFKLPPGYRNLVSSCFGFQGWGGHARFEIDPSDLDTFIASTRIEGPFSMEEMPTSSYFPTNLPSHLYGKYETLRFSQHILIDTSTQESYVIYVEVFSG